MNEAANSPKKKAAQARKLQLEAEKRRARTTRIVGALVVVVLVAGIIGGAVIFSNSKTSSTAQIDPNAASPTGVSTTTYAYPVRPAKAGVPNVSLWEDFQCPGCAQFEKLGYSDALIKAAAAGTINLELRPATFLDQRFPGSDSSSARAAAAWGCGIDAGKATEYHSAVFAAQPSQEGTGYTNKQLIEIGRGVGIAGPAADTFTQCFEGGKYLGWASNSNVLFSQSGVGGTPATVVNGKEVPWLTPDKRYIPVADFMKTVLAGG